MINKNILLSGLAGGLIGAVTALLLAPKAGRDLIKDMKEALKEPDEILHPTVLHTENSNPVSGPLSRKKSALTKSNSKKGKASRGEKFIKSRKSAPSKKKSAPEEEVVKESIEAIPFEGDNLVKYK